MSYPIGLKERDQAGSPSEYIPPSLREQLVSQKTRLERSLTDVNNALFLLDENPTFEKVQDAIAKTQLLLR